MLRNGEQLLLAVVIPVIVLVGGVAGADRLGLDFDHPAVDVLTPGVLALAVMSTAFTSLAIATGFERRYGVLKRLGASPLPRSGLLLGKVGALLVVEVLQVARASRGRRSRSAGTRDGPAARSAPSLAVLLGTAAFASLGLLVAGALRAEATLAAANLVYLLLLAGGARRAARVGVRRLRRRSPRWLPSGALGDGDARRARSTARVDLARPRSCCSAWAVVGTVADRAGPSSGSDLDRDRLRRWLRPLALGQPRRQHRASWSPAARCG